MSAKAILSASVSAAPVYVEDVFSTFLYTGNNSTQTITNGIDLSGKGGLVWMKARVNSATAHNLYDTARGALKFLISNVNGGENPADPGTGLTAFNSNGFSLGSNWNDENRNNQPTVSWTFRKAAKFFDVVTYTGTGANRTIAHNLGSVPGSIIVKRTDTTAAWAVYHRSLANTQYLVLNSTAAAATGATWWNSTTPTSSVFSVGTDASVNASGGTYVAYLFAHDAGGFGTAGTDSVISCGSFVGNGQVTFGWEPQFILIKDPGGVGDWYVMDTMRNWDIASGGSYLRPNSSGAEAAGAGFGNPNATGWNKLGGGTYLYIAIRRGPMKTPTVGTSVFSAITATASTGTSRTVGFPADTYLSRLPGTVNGGFWQDRLRGFEDASGTTTGKPAFDWPNNTNAESTGGYPASYQVWNTTAKDGGQYSGSNTLWYYFRRAPGFFDVVAFMGAASTFSVTHNLAVVPELILIKKRIDVSSTGFAGWWVLSSLFSGGFMSGGSTSRLFLNTDAAAAIGASNVLNSIPTSTTLSLLDTNFNAADSFVAYLFATAPGVSKVFNFTGTGTTLQIDCGFTSGARLVLIKRTDSTGDWYIWDSARGIISGNDPYLLLNSTAAEVTNTDYIDPYSAGFEISSTAPAAINANGGSYIGLAIA